MAKTQRTDKGIEQAPVLTGMVRRFIETFTTKEEAAEFFSVSPMRIHHWMSGAHVVPAWVIEKVFAERNKGTQTDSEEEFEAEARETTLEETQPVVVNWGEEKKLQLCIPWYKSTSPLTAFSLMALYEKGKMGIIMNCGDAFISHARNKTARTFLKSGSEWSLWVDDDMVLPMGNGKWYNAVTGFNLPEPFASYHTINRLLSHGKTLVGGLYFGRQSSGRPMYAEGVSSMQEASTVRRGPQNLCKPTKWVATGCMLIHRTVFEDIDKKFPHLNQAYFSPSEHDLINHVETLQTLLANQALPPEQRITRATAILHNGRLLSNTNSRVGVGEDVIFCTRAAAAGHQPHIDLGLVVGHLGTECFGPHNTSPLGGGTRV